MTRGQLSAICRLLELTPIGTSNFLRLQVFILLFSKMHDFGTNGLKLC